MHPLILVPHEMMERYDILNRFTNIKLYGSHSYYHSDVRMRSNSYYLNIGLKTDENKIKILNEIFTLNNLTDNVEEKELNQILMILYLDTAQDEVNKIGEAFVLDYTDKLFKHGMELQWTMLLEYHQFYHNNKYTDDFKTKFNDKLLKHCNGHNPNKEAFIDKYGGGSLYPPLYALIKTLEAFHDGYYSIDIYSIYRDFINYMKIGCDPNYVHCDYYQVKNFPIGLSELINKEYIYTQDDVIKADLNVVIKRSDLCEKKVVSKSKNLSLIRLILFIVDEYAKLNYVIDKSELHFVVD